MSIALDNKNRLYSAALAFSEFPGVVGDGVNNDTAGMQAALDAAPAGSVVRGTPGKTYKFTTLLCAKALTIDFQGADLIVSPGVASLSAGTPAIRFQAELGTSYALNSTTSFTSSITTTTAANAGNFAAGDWVVVSDSKDMRGWDQDIGGATSTNYTGRSEINRVDSVDAGTGVVILKKPVEHLYDSTPILRKITSPIYRPRILNAGEITEVNPGGVYVGSFGTTDLPYIFSFVHCIQPEVDGIRNVDGWQLHIVQFTRCASPLAQNINCVNPFRADSGGHGYAVQFERSSNGLATRIEGHGTRHLVDFTMSYDCTSMLNTGYDPRAAQFFCHGQASRRCKSIDDTVYTNQSIVTGTGWYCGNPAFNADYDYTVIRPTYVGNGGTGPFLASTNSERMTVIDPTVRVTKTTGTCRVFEASAGAVDTKMIGGVIDMSAASGSASDTGFFTRDTTNVSDLVGIKPVNITIDGTKFVGGTESGSNAINLTLMSGVARIKADFVGSANNTNAIRVAADCLLTEFTADESTFSGTWARGVQTLVAPSGIYSIRRIKNNATFATGLFVLTAADALVLDDAVGVVKAGDAAVSAAAGTTAAHIIYAVPIAADRAVSLGTSIVWDGARFRVTRTAAATGAFNVNVGTGPLKALAAGTWCEVTYDAAATAWALTAYGAL